MPSQHDLERRAAETVASVADDPEGRLRLREAFYHRFGFGEGAGYGSSELDFLRWEIKRGVLNPLTAPTPGSPWWRAVNGGLLRQATCAELLYDAGVTDAPDLGTARWLEYLRSPSAQSWYRAHNTSIVSGYLDCARLAAQESEAEQGFMNIVLYRVLYAQSMVERDAPGLLQRLRLGRVGALMGGRMGRLIGGFERLMADPRLPSVDLIVHLRDFYPFGYPLKGHELHAVLGRPDTPGELVERIFDRVVIGSGMAELYRDASEWLSMPEIEHLIDGERPVYPVRLVAIRD